MRNFASMKVAIIGGGAAGFFLAIQVKTACPEAEVCILERQRKVLAKVEISGGGRCNCTNSFAEVTDLTQVYPRGARLLKRLFRQFDHHDMMGWLEAHGVPLVVQEDQCVFPKAQDSHAIIDCFLRECRRLGIKIRTGVDGFAEVFGNEEGGERNGQDSGCAYDVVAITTGGMKGSSLPGWMCKRLKIETPLPSLFTFKINDPQLCALMGTVVEGATASIPGTKWRATGPLLVTHWGMSGPAILKLSSHAARHLAEQGYQSPLSINWTGEGNSDMVRQELQLLARDNAQRQVQSVRPFGLQRRLWEYLTGKLSLHAEARWADLGKKNMNRLVELLTNDTYAIAGRGMNKEEFVTCGGVALSCLDSNTLELKVPGTGNEEGGIGERPRIFMAGEVLDIDGVTGGFNFQAAWSTAYAAAQGIALAFRAEQGG